MLVSCVLKLYILEPHTEIFMDEMIFEMCFKITGKGRWSIHGATYETRLAIS